MQMIKKFSLVQGVPSFRVAVQSRLPYGDRPIILWRRRKIAGTEMRSGSPLSKVSAAASSAKKKMNSLVKLLYLANRIRKLVSGLLKPVQRLQIGGTPMSLVLSCLLLHCAACSLGGREYSSSPGCCPAGTGSTLLLSLETQWCVGVGFRVLQLHLGGWPFPCCVNL